MRTEEENPPEAGFVRVTRKHESGEWFWTMPLSWKWVQPRKMAYKATEIVHPFEGVLLSWVDEAGRYGWRVDWVKPLA